MHKGPRRNKTLRWSGGAEALPYLRGSTRLGGVSARCHMTRHRSDQLYATWLEWLKAIDRDVARVFRDRFMWREVAVMTEATKLPSSHIFNGLNTWYAQSQMIAVRRQAEIAPSGRKHVVSLAALLDQMARHPSVMTRDRYVSLYPPNMRPRGDAAFDRIAGVGESRIPVEAPRAALQDVAEAASPLKEYVDRVVAHSDRRRPRTIPTFGELDHAIDVVGFVFTEWSQWLTANVRWEMEPVFQYDWKAPFRVAWLPARKID